MNESEKKNALVVISDRALLEPSSFLPHRISDADLAVLGESPDDWDETVTALTCIVLAGLTAHKDDGVEEEVLLEKIRQLHIIYGLEANRREGRLTMDGNFGEEWEQVLSEQEIKWQMTEKGNDYMKNLLKGK